MVISLLDELKDYRDAAEFEARVAHKMSLSLYPEDFCIASVGGSSIPCMHEESCAWCKLKGARLMVEEEMEKEEKTCITV